ncbi:MAG TPA: ABC transporter permease, partial [Chitinophagaceae bacterium]|nr:ABC transporter permease [Chitinophagaceae bacterium]
MWNNYLLVALRSLKKNKTFSVINIFGLALGLTCSIFIFLWVRDEYNIDAFHDKADRIYIVTSREYVDNEVIGSYDTPGLLGEELKKVIPEVELACNYG